MRTTKKKRFISRRTFLGTSATLGAAAAVGAMFPGMRTRAADGTPLRFLVNFTRPGVAARDYLNGDWGPLGSESDFVLAPGSLLEPFNAAGIKADCVYTQWIDNLAHGMGPQVGGHPNGNGTNLTGTPLTEEPLFRFNGPDHGGWPAGPSIDQYIASRIGDATPFRSLELGVQILTGNTLQGRVCYRGPSMPVEPDHDPFSAFRRLFGESIAGDDEALMRLHADRRSVLDVVHQDLSRLRSRLPSADRPKLEAHETALRSIERRLVPSEPPPGGTVCAGPEMPETLDHLANDNFPIVGDLMQDLMVRAFACDLTRVGLIQWSCGPGPARYTWLGHTEDVHTLSHAPTWDDAAQDQLSDAYRWDAEKLARLVNLLKAVPEGEGTLLDYTVVIWTTDLTLGNSHSYRNIPYVIAGGSRAGIAPDRFLSYRDRGACNNQLWVSVCHAMGLSDVTEFGDPSLPRGPLPGLLG